MRLTRCNSGVVVDGTYLTNHELVVNQTAASLATDVHVMLGINRDESGIDIADRPSANDTFLSYFNAISQRNFPFPPNASSLLGLDDPAHPLLGLFPSLVTDTPSPDDIFNVTTRLFSDALFTCYSLAKAYSAAKHSAFKKTYFFEFNRTYQPAGYSQPWCVPPKTPSHPDGDPEKEYYKCHAGEQMVVFATARRGGLPDRDGKDVPFMQLVVDYWAAFARTGDPNPEFGWLEARGHEGTLKELERTGRWEAVDSDGTMRVLQWGGRQVRLGSGHEEACKALGVPVDALEG